MITLREDGFASTPVIICDSCGQTITLSRPGMVVWKYDESEKARFVHKRVVNPKCDDDSYDLSMEIEEFLNLLLNYTWDPQS